MSYKCVNCKPGCFSDAEDKCTSISFSNDTLDIESGVDSLQTALIKIADEVVCLKENECDPCNKCKELSSSTVDSDVGTISTATNKSDSIYTDNSITLKVTPGSISTSIEYDFRKTISDIGATSSIVNVQAYGMKGGVIGRLFSSSSQSGTFQVSPEGFPISFEAEVTALTATGQSILKFKKSLLNSKSETKESFELVDLSRASINNQKDVNEHFDRKIGSMENQINNIENVNSNGKMGFNSIFSDLQSQIDVLKAEIESLKSS